MWRCLGLHTVSQDMRQWPVSSVLEPCGIWRLNPELRLILCSHSPQVPSLESVNISSRLF